MARSSDDPSGPSWLAKHWVKLLGSCLLAKYSATQLEATQLVKEMEKPWGSRWLGKQLGMWLELNKSASAWVTMWVTRLEIVRASRLAWKWLGLW